MAIEQDQVIHSKSGRLGAEATSVSDARRIAEQAWTQGKAGCIVMHFHGGLVGKDAAYDGARRLYKTYAKMPSCQSEA
jgi:hypothetical protein